MSPRTRQRPGVGAPDAAKTTAAVTPEHTPPGTTIADRVAASRARQGLPAKVTDPDVLTRLAVIVSAVNP